jgi:hypothetical protein
MIATVLEELPEDVPSLDEVQQKAGRKPPSRPLIRRRSMATTRIPEQIDFGSFFRSRVPDIVSGVAEDVEKPSFENFPPSSLLTDHLNGSWVSSCSETVREAGGPLLEISAGMDA